MSALLDAALDAALHAMEDRLREARIRRYRDELLAATTWQERARAWHKMRDEIRGRSPEAVLRMERDRGLE